MRAGQSLELSEARTMPTSRGRHCRRCHTRISRRMRLCPICKAVNLKSFDYVIIALLLLAGCAVLALALWGSP